MSVKMIGDPHVTAGLQVEFGDYIPGIGGGFPDFCQSKEGVPKRIKWWITKVSHTVDSQGYNMDVEIVDAFTLTNGVQVG